MNKCVREVKGHYPCNLKHIVTNDNCCYTLIETIIDVLSIDEIIVPLVNSKYCVNIMNTSAN